MSFLTPQNLSVFDEPRASDPAFDIERARVRDKLLRLHDQIYPVMRERRWDLHAYPMFPTTLTSLRASVAAVHITSLTLPYGKPEMLTQLMKKEFGSDWSNWYANATIAVQVDAKGLIILLYISERAWVDGQNFKTKLVRGAPQKQAFRQLCAQLGGAYELRLYETGTRVDSPSFNEEILRVRCSRLVNLGVLNAALEKYVPGVHDLSLSIRYAPEDSRLEPDHLAHEIIFRMGELYPLYQFASWSPRNNFVPRADRSEERPAENT